MATTCRKCGASVSGGTNFCQSCGAPIIVPYGATANSDESVVDMFFRHDGRLNRKPYIFRSLALCVVQLILNLVAFVSESSVFALVSIVCMIAIVVASIKLMIRRLHDLDKTGWFSILTFVPFVNIIFGIYLWVVKGTDGGNRFGPDPLRV